jgi:hypothetical protein
MGKAKSAGVVKKCWEYLGCGGARRRNCPALKKGKETECWSVAGSLCPDLDKSYGWGVKVKARDCRSCEYYKHRGGK